MNIIYLRCLIEFAFNSQCVIGATQILPITLWDLLFMTRKRQISLWDIIWNLKIVKEIEAIGNIRRFTTECIKCGKVSDKYMNIMFASKTWCKCTKTWWKIKPTSSRTIEQRKLRSLFYGIRARCVSKHARFYSLYYEKGIKCEWNSFEEFYRDMWDTYKIGLSIDRIDGDKNYCKENCRWATYEIQNNNRSNNVIVEWWLTLSQWCAKNGVYDRYRMILHKYTKWDSLETILNDIEHIKSRKLQKKNKLSLAL